MEPTIVISIIALLLSFLSIYTTVKLWFLENRPIVTAEITEESSGVGTALLNLTIYNSGNRPATNIYFEAEKENINKIISQSAKKEHIKEIDFIFSKSAIIPLLLNGDQTKTAFFSFSNNQKDADILLCNSSLPIKVYYSDNTGKKYTSSITILIKDKKGFGGSVWE